MLTSMGWAYLQLPETTVTPAPKPETNQSDEMTFLPSKGHRARTRCAPARERAFPSTKAMEEHGKVGKASRNLVACLLSPKQEATIPKQHRWFSKQQLLTPPWTVYIMLKFDIPCLTETLSVSVGPHRCTSVTFLRWEKKEIRYT